MAAEMGPDDLTMRAVAHRMRLQDPPVWRVLPYGRTDILFLVAADLQMGHTKAVATHDGLHKRTARARVEAHLARMLAFDFEPPVKEWRRAGPELDAPAARRSRRGAARPVRADRERPWPSGRRGLGALREHLQRRLRDGLDARASHNGARRAAAGGLPGPPKAGTRLMLLMLERRWIDGPMASKGRWAGLGWAPGVAARRRAARQQWLACQRAARSPTPPWSANGNAEYGTGLGSS
jgi:hypothetical protein